MFKYLLLNEDPTQLAFVADGERRRLPDEQSQLSEKRFFNAGTPHRQQVQPKKNDEGMQMSSTSLGDILAVQRESHLLGTHSTETARTYRSNARMMRDRAKHVRQRFDARDMYRQPVTESQRIGWFPQVNAPKKPEHGKIACKETKVRVIARPKRTTGRRICFASRPTHGPADALRAWRVSLLEHHDRVAPTCS